MYTLTDEYKLLRRTKERERIIVSRQEEERKKRLLEEYVEQKTVADCIVPNKKNKLSFYTYRWFLKLDI